MIRQPIISVLGHVDSGKTTLLDCIRGTAVAKSEPGLITQAIGATVIPIGTIKKICGKLLEKFKIDLKTPGLLMIDTPGHESFTTLRMRGGSIADLAILVIDVHEGIMPQTDESLRFLRDFKTPFVVAVTKIDLINGWVQNPGAPFTESFRGQNERVRNMLDEHIYKIIGQLSERGYNAERFDRVRDFKNQVAIVPCSGKTGEGIAELLVVLAGVAQQFLTKRLKLSELAQGAVLEVKTARGFGTTLDVILYDGEITNGDFLIIGGKKTVITKIKALLMPPILRELRVERHFRSVQRISAAAGVKIAAPGLEDVVAGAPIVCVKKEKDIEKAKKLVQREVSLIEFKREIDGVIAKADSFGSLEAIIKSLEDVGVKIRGAEIGSVNKADVLEVGSMPPKMKLIFAFNVPVHPDAAALAKNYGVEIISDRVIYRLLEAYKEWEKKRKEREREAILARLIRPGKIRLLPGYVFRKSKPAIVGVEIIAGTLKPGYKLAKGEKIIGEVDQIQRENENVHEAVKGDRVALSIPGVTVGRQISEGDLLYVALTREGILELEKSKKLLRQDELEVLEEIKEILKEA